MKLSLLKRTLLIVFGCFAVSVCAQEKPKPTWILTWSEEFTAPDGAPVDSQKWNSATGGNGWGNNELEYYTTSIHNAHQEHGSLVIEAIQEPYTGSDGVKRNYTSASLKTPG